MSSAFALVGPWRVRALRWVPYDGTSDPVPVAKRRGWIGPMQLWATTEKGVRLPIASVTPTATPIGRQWEARVFQGYVGLATSRRAAMRDVRREP